LVGSLVGFNLTLDLVKTFLEISSASFLGGQYVEIIPGASDVMLQEEETLYNTRDPVSLTDLLGQAVFSATN